MASEARSGQGTLRTVALASGGETADNRPSAVRCQPPTAEHSPLGAAVCGSDTTTDDGENGGYRDCPAITPSNPLAPALLLVAGRVSVPGLRAARARIMAS
jgi:hypothetical protein